MEPPTPKGGKKGGSRSEFSSSVPLPPIGLSVGQEDDREGDQLSDGNRSTRSSISQGSTAAFNRVGEGVARPRIVRGFRPEAYSDDEDEDSRKLARRVSFTAAKQRVLRGESPEQMETTRRLTYDGREIEFVTLNTQTDWDWVSEVESSTARTLGSEKAPSEKAESSTSRKGLKDVVDASPRVDEPTPRETRSYPVPYSDEYGIPILDLSSDSEDSSDEEFMVKKKIKDERVFMPSVGPPQILQYQRESEKHEIGVKDPESRLPKTEEAGGKDELEKDEHGLTHGMFSGKCEFCHRPVKPFPSLDQQLQQPPEELYCCDNYREFVEYVLMTTQELEEEQEKKNKMISVKVHGHVGSKQERNAAKEKAVQRMRERELARRAQEASGLQQNFFASMQMSGIGGLAHMRFAKGQGFTIKDVYAEELDQEGTHNTRLPSKCSGTSVLNIGTGRSGSHVMGMPGSAVSQLIGTPMSGALGGRTGVALVPEKTSLANAGFPTRRYNDVGGGAWQDGMKYMLLASHSLAKPVDLKNVKPQCVNDCLVARTKIMLEMAQGTDAVLGVGSSGSGRIQRHSEACDLYRHAQYISAFIDALRKRLAVARQMKTINYQLSSQKCLEEGWTLRAPSPILEDLGDNVFEPEPLDPAMIAEGRLRDRPLIEKFYEGGKKFLTMFPDGTGNVFYPSGNLAILISSVKLGQYYYTIHHDVARSGVAAAFEPNGYGYCYYPNGEVRLYIDQYGGIELDEKGGKKRKWQWKDHVTHVHAPPFQPICIGLNRHLAVRVMSQENIAVTFSAHQRSCRFNMGSRLKLVAPENVPLKEIEENQIYLEEKKHYVGTLLDKVSTLLKYPNSTKVDKILPPLHVTNKMIKTEKLKQERKSLLAQQSAREKKQSAVSVN